MPKIQATTKAGYTAVLKSSKKQYTHAWFVTIDNGCRVVAYGFTEKGAQEAAKAGSRSMVDLAKGAGYREEDGKHISYASRGLQYEVAEVSK